MYYEIMYYEIFMGKFLESFVFFPKIICPFLENGKILGKIQHFPEIFS